MSASKLIVQITPSFWPEIGGVETHVLQVSKRLVQRGFSVVVVTKRATSNAPLLETYQGITIIRLPFLEDLSDKNAYRRSVWSEMVQLSWLWQQAEIIQVHDVGWWLGSVIFKAGIRKKMHVTFHGWEGVFPVPWKHKLHRSLLALFAQTSLHIGAWIQELYWDRSTAVSYGGVALPSVKTKNARGKKPLRIVFLGRLEAENTIKEYVGLVQLLKKKWPNVEMIWVGDGSLRSMCEQVGTVTGWVQDPKDWLSTADVVCANSYLAMLEAQAHGALVCALYAHALKKRYVETFPGSDYILSSHSKNELYQSLSEVLSNAQLLAAYQKNARQFAETMSWNRVVDQYQELWKVV